MADEEFRSMTEAKHTPEPWGVWREPHEHGTITDELGRHIARLLNGTHETDANAERIVSCVNACAGLADPSAVPDLLEACKAALPWVAVAQPDNDAPRDAIANHGEDLAALKAAIAKAEGNENTPARP